MRLINQETQEVKHFDTDHEAMAFYFRELKADPTWKFEEDKEVEVEVVEDSDDWGFEPTSDAMDSLSEALNPVLVEEIIEPKGTIESGNTRLTKTGVVSQVAVERIDRHQEALTKGFEELGLQPIVHAPPVFATGTSVRADGNKRFREFRQSFDEMPDADVSLEQLIEIINDEQRMDLDDINASELRMEDDGTLSHTNFSGLKVEHNGLRDLLSRMRADHHLPMTDSNLLFPNGFQQFMALDPDVRAHVFNSQMAKANEAHEVKLRTRMNGGDRSLFGVVSPGYSVVDADQIASSLVSGFDFAGAKGKLLYNPAKASVTFDALWMPNEVTDLAAGDVFKVGLRLKTNDAGKGSINGGGISFRNLCLNLIILDELYVPQFRIRHWGNVQEVEQVLIQNFELLKKGFNVFLQDWGYLNETPINKVDIWGQRFESVTDALDYGVKNKEIGKDVADKVLVKALVDGYDFEEGNTLESLVNAMTRGAWVGLLDECERATLEREAGALVPVLAASAKNQNVMYGGFQ